MSKIWKAGKYELKLTQGKPLLMGIVNVTPDSFSDGGRYHSAALALSHAELLLTEGADVLDIGGESTRPGAQAVPEEEEWSRLEPLLEEVTSWKVPVSVDTMKPVIMQRARDMGVDIINDVNGFRSPGAISVLAGSTMGAVVMHMLGEPRTMQDEPHYVNVLEEVKGFLHDRVSALLESGVEASRVLVDPGFGFGKVLHHNITLMHQLSAFSELGAGVLAGVSRKRMIGQITGHFEPQKRISGSVAAALFAAQKGAAVVRVHDVQATKDALAVWQAMSNPLIKEKQ